MTSDGDSSWAGKRTSGLPDVHWRLHDLDRSTGDSRSEWFFSLTPSFKFNSHYWKIHPIVNSRVLGCESRDHFFMPNMCLIYHTVKGLILNGSLGRQAKIVLQQFFWCQPSEIFPEIFYYINPYLEHFGEVVERHLWTKNPQQIAAFDFLDFMKNSYLGTSWSVIRDINNCGFFVHKWRSIIFPETNFSEFEWIFCPQITLHDIPGLWIFFVHNSQIGVKSFFSLFASSRF